MNRKPVHRAFVEEVADNIGHRAFVASCHATGIRCDWIGWPDLAGGELEAISYSVECLNGDRGAGEFCNARHVI